MHFAGIAEICLMGERNPVDCYRDRAVRLFNSDKEPKAQLARAAAYVIEHTPCERSEILFTRDPWLHGYLYTCR